MQQRVYLSSLINGRGEHRVTMDFSCLKTNDNPVIESFNGSLRDECLNIHWFLSLEDARALLNKSDFVSLPVAGCVFRQYARFQAYLLSSFCSALVPGP
jgi:hypothetical protein